MATYFAKSFKELRVYQKAREVSQAVFHLSKAFPKEETYSLTDQIRRSSRSVGAQIAEAWGKRRYEKHFVSKLTDADAEQMETQHWVSEALGCGYLSDADVEPLNARLKETGRMLHSMIEKADLFCPSGDGIVREKSTEYFIPNHRPPTTDHRPPTTDHRPLITDY